MQNDCGNKIPHTGKHQTRRPTDHTPGQRYVRADRAPISGRTPLEQALANLDNALRVLAMAPRGDAGGLCPHPLDVVAAELRNARAYVCAGASVMPAPAGDAS